MEDTRNFIEFTQDRARNSKIGRELSASEMVDEFIKVGPNERVEHLTKIDGDLKMSDLSLEQAAKFHAYRRALSNANRRLMDIDR